MPFRHQHAFHLAQHLVRIGVEFQGMRHHHEVDAVCGEGQIMQVRADLRDAVVAPVVATEAQRHPVRAEEVVAGQGKLHRVEAEDVGHQQIVLLLFPVEHILSGRCLQPVFETLN